MLNYFRDEFSLLVSNMSERLPQSESNDGSKNLVFFEEAFEKLADEFKTSSASVVSQFEEVRSAIKGLKNALSREKVDSIVELIKKGTLDAAKEKMKLDFPNLEIGSLEAILKLSYTGTTTENLKNAINFVTSAVDVNNLKFAGYNAIYQEMKFKNHTTEIEILLLEKAVDELDFQEKNSSQVRKELKEDKDKLISKIVQEIGKGESLTSKKICDGLDSNILNSYIPKCIDSFFTGTLENMLLIIKYSMALPYIENNCYVIGATFKHLKKQNLLESEQALHLWANAKYYMDKDNFHKVAQNAKNLCIDACGKLAENKGSLFEIYKQYIENTNKDAIKQLHVNNWHFVSIVPEFIKYYYAGNVKRARNLLQAAEACTHYVAIGAFLNTLHAEMENHNQLVSFEAFQLFHGLKIETRHSNYETFKHDGNIAVKDLTALEKKVPKCIYSLLWGDTKKCRIVNKYFAEPLFSSAQDQTVFTWVPKKWREDQFWNVSVDGESSLVTFLHDDSENLQLDGKKVNGVDWMIKALDDEYFKIFKTTGKIFHFSCVLIIKVPFIF